MKREYFYLCRLLNEALHPCNEYCLTKEEYSEAALILPKILSLGRSHGVLVPLYDRVFSYRFPIPEQIQSQLQGMTASLCQRSYQMLSFAQKLNTLLSENHIPHHFLKGLTIATCYPSLDFRRYSDIDILVSNPDDFTKARNIFRKEGFIEEDDHVNYHITLIYENDRTRFIVELHRNVMESVDFDKTNRQILRVFKNLPVHTLKIPNADFSISTLPITENVFHILLHMMNHFLKKGFGIKFLCDWTMYLERYHTQIDKKKLNDYLQRFGLDGFCNGITALCVKYFGLPYDKCSFLLTEPLTDVFLEELLEDIIDAGEYGKDDTSRMLAVTNNGRIAPYIRELHRQMKLRFPRLCYVIILWPFLWCITGGCFLWNNRFLRKVSTKDLLNTTKKRHELVKQLKIFR